MKKTKVILFTSHGINANLVYSFLVKKYTVIGVVFDSPGSKKKMIQRRIKRLGFFKVLLQLLFMKGVVPLLNLEGKKRKNEILSGFNLNLINGIPNSFFPKSINDPEVIKYVNKLAPDVIMVSGTRLIQKKIIEAIKAPLLNMHVGITPKYRGVHGGYWALVNKDLKHCGVTVHFIDPGIDTGGVISQKTIVPTRKDNYATYPMLQIIKGLECIEEAISEIETNQLTVKQNGLSSKLYYHPTITSYLYHRIVNGVK